MMMDYENYIIFKNCIILNIETKFFGGAIYFRYDNDFTTESGIWQDIDAGAYKK